MVDKFYIDQNSQNIIQKVVNDVLRSGRSVNSPLQQLGHTTEVYIAHTDENTTIPSMTNPSGTGSSAGTGTFIEPPWAMCEVYQIVSDTLMPCGFSVKVYNISSQDVPSNNWFAVGREKFGNWIALMGGGSGGATLIDFMLVDEDVGSGTGTGGDPGIGGHYDPELGQSYKAIVLGYSCGSTAPETNEGYVDVHDTDGCWFDVPFDKVEYLVGCRGTAVQMRGDGGSCFWKVVAFCKPCETYELACRVICLYDPFLGPSLEVRYAEVQLPLSSRSCTFYDCGPEEPGTGSGSVE